MGTIDGTARNFEGGFKAVKLKPKAVYILDEDLLYGKLNAFQEIEEYMKIRSKLLMQNMTMTDSLRL